MSREAQRGGPARQAGHRATVSVRLSAAELALLDAWRAKQDDLPARPEAVRRLVERALAEQPVLPPVTAGTARTSGIDDF